MRILLSATVLFSLSISAQTTFAPIGAKWTYTVQYPTTGDSAVLHVHSIGDTIMAGRTCRILSYDLPLLCMQDYRYVSTSNDTVLFWEPITSSFSILFIANAFLGQTWFTTISDEWTGLTQDVFTQNTGSTSVVIDGLTLSQFDPSYLNYPPFGVWPYPITERLGSPQYMFNWLYANCEMDFIPALRCYEDADISWLSPLYPQCDLSTGITEANGQNTWSILPNVIERNTSATLICEPGSDWSLFDAQGRLVSSGNAIAGRTAINIARPGGYLLVLSGNGSILGRERVTVH